jgi:UDP-N-acetylglucosamine 2-epimerase (non-hydrolysing)
METPAQAEEDPISFGRHTMSVPSKVVACVVGTRPEAIKMAPLILRLRQLEGLQVRLISTGQHRELLDRALTDFGLTADRDLALMRPGQTLAEVTSRALTALDRAFTEELPDIVLAQGDTTTVLTSALASFYRKIPFGHVEAGLRTGDPDRPFPEEKNRVLTSHLATIHFAPTPRSRLNLLAEGISDRSIHVTGNTSIDALRLVADRSDDPGHGTPSRKLWAADGRDLPGSPRSDRARPQDLGRFSRPS